MNVGRAVGDAPAIGVPLHAAGDRRIPEPDRHTERDKRYALAAARNIGLRDLGEAVEQHDGLRARPGFDAGICVKTTSRSSFMTT